MQSTCKNSGTFDKKQNSSEKVIYVSLAQSHSIGEGCSKMNYNLKYGELRKLSQNLQFQKIMIHTPDEIGISCVCVWGGGGGGVRGPKRCIKLDWNFQGSDLEAFKKMRYVGEVCIFSGPKMCIKNRLGCSVGV